MLSRTALCINHQVLSRTNAVSQRIMYRSIHIACRTQTTCLKSRSILKITKYSPALASYTKRYASTTQTEVASSLIETPITKDIASGQIAENLTTTILETIPDAPIAPVIEVLSQIGEPSLKSLGLGSWWPVGIVQQGLELLHINCGLPWWESIAIGTLFIRFCLFPLVIKTQKSSARMSNNMPEFARLQAELSEARSDNDSVKVARLTNKLMKFMAEKDCNPMKNMILPLAQAPIFISVFMGLRTMAELPVESMKEGGLWWFTDLTVADPYYVLPIITAVTLLVTIEIGTDSAKAEALGMMRYALRAIPFVICPFILNFPAAILCYWCTTNFVSLLQVAILRIPTVRTFFKIEAVVKQSPAIAATKKGFVEGVKSSVANMKAAREMNSRIYVDKLQFQQAGRKPIQKTYPYDPTRQSMPRGNVMAKKH